MHSIKISEFISITPKNIIYTNGLGHTNYLTHENINDFQREKIVLKSKILSRINAFEPFFNLISNSFNKDISSINLLDYLSFIQENQLDFSLIDNDYLIKAKVIETDENGLTVFDKISIESPNLKPIFQLIKKEDFTLDIFSFKNWVYNESPDKFNNSEKIPFYFHKKEDFNFFKSCDYEMVNTFLKFNKIIIKQEYNTLTLDKKMSTKLAIFLRIFSLSKNNFNQIKNLEFKNKLIFALYRSFEHEALSFFNNDIIEKLSSLYHIFYNDFLETENYIDGDLELLKEKIAFYTNCLFYFIQIYKYKIDNQSVKNEFALVIKNNPDVIKFYNSIQSMKSFYNLVNDINYFQGIANQYSNVLNNNENLPDKPLSLDSQPFYLNNNKIILFPLQTDFDFNSESAFMNNCVRSHVNSCALKNIISNNTQQRNGNNISLMFHYIAKKDGTPFEVKDISKYYLQDMHKIKGDGVVHHSIKISFSVDYLSQFNLNDFIIQNMVNENKYINIYNPKNFIMVESKAKSNSASMLKEYDIIIRDFVREYILKNLKLSLKL